MTKHRERPTNTTIYLFGFSSSHTQRERETNMRIANERKQKKIQSIEIYFTFVRTDVQVKIRFCTHVCRNINGCKAITSKATISFAQSLQFRAYSFYYVNIDQINVHHMER